MSINSWKEQVQLIIKDSREKLQTLTFISLNNNFFSGKRQ